MHARRSLAEVRLILLQIKAFVTIFAAVNASCTDLPAPALGFACTCFNGTFGDPYSACSGLHDSCRLTESLYSTGLCSV